MKRDKVSWNDELDYSITPPSSLDLEELWPTITGY